MGQVNVDWHNKPQNMILGGRPFRFKSKFESKWARYLQALLELGAITEWDYEPRRFEFKERHRHRRVYTPDFSAVEKLDGGVTTAIWYETKTALQQKDILRFKYLFYDYPSVANTMILVLPCGSKKMKQIDLKGKAMKYISRIVYANPLFRQFNIK